MSQTIIFALGTALVAIFYSLIVGRSISKKDQGNDKVKEIGKAIHQGAMAFLKQR